MMPSTIALTSGCVSGRGSGLAGAGVFGFAVLGFAGFALIAALDAASAAPLQWGETRGVA
jgi:hypothetical protein